MNTKIEFFQDDLIQAIGPGIYEILIIKNGHEDSLYIGESFSALIRCAYHLYRFTHGKK